MTKRRYTALRRARTLLIAGTWLAGLLMGAALMTLATLAFTPDPSSALLAPQATQVPNRTATN